MEWKWNQSYSVESKFQVKFLGKILDEELKQAPNTPLYAF